MAHKLNEYQGFLGQLHALRDWFRERYLLWKEEHPDGCSWWLKNAFSGEVPNSESISDVQERYSHIFR